LQASSHDPAAEAAVLGAVLVDPTAFNEVVDIISADDFYSDPNKVVWSGIVSVVDAGQSADLVTVTNYLRSKNLIGRVGGATAISQMVDYLPDVANIKSYARIVQEHGMTRRLSKIIAVAGGCDDPNKAIDMLQSGIDGLYEGSAEASTCSIGDVADEVAKRAAGLSRGDIKIRGIRSGFEGLDRYINTLHPGRLIYLAARPAAGKTTLACNIAMNLATFGGTALFVSLEMTRQELTEKMIATYAGVDSRSFQSGMFNMSGIPTDIELIDDAARIFKDRKIIIDDRAAMNSSQLRALVRRTQATHGCDLVVIDYLQLMSGPGKTQNEIYGNISKSLKRLSKELSVSVVALSQLSRAPVSDGRASRPRLTDLRDSGQLEQDADQVIFLVRDTEKTPRVAQLQLAKNRHGPIGDAPLRFNPNISKFEDGSWADFREDE
jgi:replicative DNA helicase